MMTQSQDLATTNPAAVQAIRQLAGRLYVDGFEHDHERLFALLVDVADLYRRDIGEAGQARTGSALLAVAENLELRDAESVEPPAGPALDSAVFGQEPR
jgi:hypothetical protein